MVSPHMGEMAFLPLRGVSLRKGWPIAIATQTVIKQSGMIFCRHTVRGVYDFTVYIVHWSRIKKHSNKCFGISATI